MTKPEWSSAPGFVAVVRLTLDSSSLPTPSSLLQDSLSSIPLAHVLWAPCVAFPAPTVQLRRYQAVCSRVEYPLGQHLEQPFRAPALPSQSRPRLFQFSCDTAMSAGSWDETGGVLAGGGVQYAGDGNMSLDIRLSTPFFLPLGPRTSPRGVASPSLLLN